MAWKIQNRFGLYSIIETETGKIVGNFISEQDAKDYMRKKLNKVV